MSERQESGGFRRLGRGEEQRLMRVGVIALIVILLLGFGSSALQQSAWSQGYMMGLMAGGDGDALAQYVLYNSRTGGGFPGFGFLWLLAIGAFLFVVAGKFMRMLAWRAAGGSEDMAWSPRWHQAGPPWRRPCPGTEGQSPSPETERASPSAADRAVDESPA